MNDCHRQRIAPYQATPTVFIGAPVTVRAGPYF
jgi:hypothetical protein